MHIASKKSQSFGREGLEIKQPLVNLPFIFSFGLVPDTQPSTLSSDRKPTQTNLNLENLKTSFNKELQKIGVSAKMIQEKNSLKELNSRNNSPTTGLPFLRRSRSNSPPKENLKITDMKHFSFFPPRSPVVGLHKMKFREDFTGLCKESVSSEVEEDEDLMKLKFEYMRMLEEVKCGGREDYDDIADEEEVEEVELQVEVSQWRYFK